MTKKDEVSRVRFRTKVIRKIFVTLLVGGMAYYITDLSNQSQTWSLAAGVFIGGITVVVQFLSDFENRLEKVEDGQEDRSVKMRSLIEEGFAKTNEATELFQAVEASALQTDAVTQLVRNSTHIAPDSPPLVYEFAQFQINQMSRFLKELGEGGEVSYDGEDRDWLLGLTMQCKNTIDATSLSTVDAGGKSFDGGLWTSDLGQRYLEHQREATRRGVIIRRVFIIDRSEQISEEFLRICRQQKDLGIKIRALNQSDISDSLKNSLFDFVIFDSVISYQVTPGSRAEANMPPMIVNTHLVLQQERLKERMRRFEDLWASADESFCQ